MVALTYHPSTSGGAGGEAGGSAVQDHHQQVWGQPGVHEIKQKPRSKDSGWEGGKGGWEEKKKGGSESRRKVGQLIWAPGSRNWYVWKQSTNEDSNCFTPESKPKDKLAHAKDTKLGERTGFITIYSYSNRPSPTRLQQELGPTRMILIS